MPVRKLVVGLPVLRHHERVDFQDLGIRKRSKHCTSCSRMRSSNYFRLAFAFLSLTAKRSSAARGRHSTARKTQSWPWRLLDRCTCTTEHWKHLHVCTLQDAEKNIKKMQTKATLVVRALSGFIMFGNVDCIASCRSERMSSNSDFGNSSFEFWDTLYS